MSSNTADSPLRRTVRRGIALIVFSLTLLVFLVEHYLVQQGIKTHPAIHYLALLLAGGAVLYLLVDAGSALRESAE